MSKERERQLATYLDSQKIITSQFTPDPSSTIFIVEQDSKAHDKEHTVYFQTKLLFRYH